MIEYIEREKVLECLKIAKGSCSFAYEEIKRIPAADVSPAVHGRWEPWFGNLVKCSVCGYKYVDHIECNNYCGNCGAKMDGGNTNA